MKRYISIIFVLSCLNLFSQEVRLKIDSLKISYIPLSTKTSLSLSSGDVRNFEKKYKKELIIKHDSVLKSFTNINLYAELEKNGAIEKPTIDVRAVFDVYSNDVLLFSIAMDSLGYYTMLGNVYKRNAVLLDWINRNVFVIR